MNILFSNIFYVSPTQGGTERVTYSVASALRKLGHTVYSMYVQGEDNGESNGVFRKSFQVADVSQIHQIRKIVEENNIDVIIVQGAYAQVRWLRMAISEIPICKLFFAHHFEPSWELHEFTFSSYWQRLTSASSLRSLCSTVAHIILYPIERRRYVRQLPLWYREAYENADKVILLCKGFIPQYMDFAGLSDDTKFVVIPNMLSFDHFETETRVREKSKQVLIVSRMSDPQKRISLALQLWGECMKDKTLQEWKLYLVGIGEDLDKYKRLVKDLNIPNVTFGGHQNPLPFYQTASMFMMTSRSEAWGLTLTESMQNGVVPIAFDTYASLRDIITDGKDGFIISEGDLSGYVEKLKFLMNNSDFRELMAKEGLESAKRFTSDKVGQIWHNLFMSI